MYSFVIGEKQKEILDLMNTSADIHQKKVVLKLILEVVFEAGRNQGIKEAAELLKD